MDLLKLLFLFIVILVLLALKKPLWLAITCSIILSFLFYRVPAAGAVSIVADSVFCRSTLSVILSFYTITFLQRMLEKRNLLLAAEASLNNLFRSRRVTAMLHRFLSGFCLPPERCISAVPLWIPPAAIT